MSKVKVLLGGAVLVLFVSTAWQIGVCELANYELQDEMKDMAAQNSVRIGLAPPSSDDDLRNAVASKARSHDIALEPRQVTVQRSGPEDAPKIYLATRYNARIVLPGCAITFHFAPNSGNRM